MSHPEPSPAGRVLPFLALAVALGGCGSSGGTASTTATPVPASETVASIAYPVNFQVSVSDSSPGWGEPVTVDGRVKGVGDQRRARLQFRRRGTRWKTIASDDVRADGRYAFRRRLPGPGTIRVALAEPATSGDGQPLAQASVAQPVHVTATVHVAHHALNPKKGKDATVAGRIKPDRSGRTVVAESYAGGRWRTVASARTARRGSYRLAWKPSGNHFIRVSVAGDRQAGPTNTLVGQTGKVTGIDAPQPAQPGLVSQMTATGPMRKALASRYDDYNLPLACGGTLGIHQQGVAHKTLPCGTLVTITYRGRTVRVPVIDRGPYIAPREFDLAGATANALGFEGVETILVSP